jgi:hypothetical protein
MAKYTYVVMSNPTPGKEEEYNRWYTDQHLPDVLAVPGFVAAQRFRVDDPNSKLPHRYLALYEIETEDLSKAMADLNGRAGTPAMPLSDALDVNTVSATIFAPITGRVLPRK